MNVPEEAPAFAKGCVAIHGVSEGRGEPDPIGSGVLLSVGDSVFLLTAAHVLDWHESTGLYFGCGEDLIPLVGTNHSTSILTSREDDLLDIGIMALDSTTRSSIGGRCLGVIDLDVDEQTSRESRYLVVGYPLTKNRPRYGRSTVQRTRLLYRTQGLQDAEVRQLQLAVIPETHVVVPFSRRDALTNKFLPRLEGVSGGGVWRIERSRIAPAHEVGRLVGIVVQFGNEKRQTLLATRVSLFVAALRSVLPWTSEHLPSPTRVKVNVSQ